MHDSHKPPNGSPEQDLARAISAMVSEGIASARNTVDKIRDTGADALDAAARQVRPKKVRNYTYAVGAASFVVGLAVGALVCMNRPEQTLTARSKTELRKLAKALSELAV